MVALPSSFERFKSKTRRWPSRHRRWLWYWAEQLDLEWADDAVVRRLGANAVAVALYVGRCYGAERTRAMRFAVDQIAQATRLKPYAVKRALARLRQAGCIKSWCKKRVRHKAVVLDTTDGAPERAYGSELFIWPLASFAQARLDFAPSIAVPHETFAWAAGRMTHGGKRAGAGRPRHNQDVPSVGPAATGECLLTPHAGKSSCAPKELKIYSNTTSLFCKQNSAAAEPAEPFCLKNQNPEGVAMSDEGAARKGEPPALPLIEHARRQVVVYPAITPRWPVPLRLKAMARAYRAAVEKHYGYDPKTFAFSDPRHSRMYGQLAKGAEAMAEHELPPELWADWCVARDKRNGLEKPSYFNTVFSRKRIDKWRGWFRREVMDNYEDKSHVDQLEIAQMFRIQEEQALRRGVAPDVALWPFPPWYGEVREAEIAKGHHSPLACFPRREGKGRR